MAFQNTHPFYGSSGGGMSASGDQRRLALDNLLRRELKISDPNDPKAVANALLERFKDDPRANAITQEAKGLPFLQAASSPNFPMQSATSSSAELQQAKDDVERDLQELLTNSLLKDVTQEIQGWAQAVRSAIAEGTTAARFALDPRQRDKAFAIRRQLGDYARLARLVGALTPTLNMTYRKFAQSLDEVAAVILVTMGEAMSNVGFNGGRFLLQAPYTELQVRRDAVIYALRNLVGATQQAYGPNDWPRGLDAYRSLYRLLEVQGQGDLRSLLIENELSRIMDELIQRSAHGTADGLRALGSTAQIDLNRFRRLVFIGQHAVSPESPPLSAFLQAIQLFADAFDASGGFRLLRISRPPILFYGLYGVTTMEDADQRLLNLIIERGLLADQLDCFMQCSCSADAVKCQVILDKILYDLDRAIDLYALGKDNFGQPERRAAAYSFVIEAFKEHSIAQEQQGCGLYNVDSYPNNAIAERLERIIDSQHLRPAFGSVESAIAKELQTLAEATTTPNNLTSLLNLYTILQKNPGVVIPNSIQNYLDVFQQELCLQADTEARWENLVRTMAPNCAGMSEVFNAVSDVIQKAIDKVSAVECPEFKPSIPPHFETSLDSMVDDVDRIGRGRPTPPSDYLT